MTSTRRTGGFGTRARRVAWAAAATAAAIASVSALSGFHVPLREIDPKGAAAASEVVTAELIGIRTFTAPEGITVEADLEYGAREDGTLLTLDLCMPAGAELADELLPAVVSIHGGSWARGDKGNADWRNVCLWFASEGFVAASVNYRLVPDARFPAAIDDVALAVEWLRDPAQAERLGIDPGRIGAFGGSAGGNLAALLGTTGEGPLDTGSRVAAVAELSGPVGLGAAELAADGASGWLRGIIGEYLDCEPGASDEQCAQAMDASAASFADSSDPPFFIGHAESEVVPLGQSERFAAALTAAGVPAELAIVPGADHSIGILDAQMRARIAAFLHAHLD
ncbi:alpha/beta hydrolase [Agromyces cerinus]|uniref:Acetyl esterase/lipase n=1 Tax=Agromyces cerinus subsp. cerinus TaxID=232089 RepID=A0A1N6EXB7_9MICO|nr:alpha/beta hydrolase [Agromyces cerinus]SIN87607.1 Acetyl esterase/lipase [Agromyces cerinus subsp. cerinus]